MMDRTWKNALAAVALAFALGHAAAQEPDATQLLRGGLQVIQMVDQNRIGEIWDGAAPVAQKRVARADFIQQVAQARAPLGAPQQRQWAAIHRQAVAGGDAELAGQYVNVEYETRFSGGRTVREMATFQLGPDGVWRVSGYFLR